MFQTFSGEGMDNRWGSALFALTASFIVAKNGLKIGMLL